MSIISFAVTQVVTSKTHHDQAPANQSRQLEAMVVPRKVASLSEPSIEALKELKIDKLISNAQWATLLDSPEAVAALYAQSCDLIETCIKLAANKTKTLCCTDVASFAPTAFFLVLREYDPNKDKFSGFIRSRLPFRILDQIRGEGRDIDRQLRRDRRDKRIEKNQGLAAANGGTMPIRKLRPSPVAISLESPRYNDQSQAVIADLAMPGQSHTEQIEITDSVLNLRNRLNELSPTMKKVVEYLNIHQITQSQAGNILGVSESRISQILAATYRALKSLAADTEQESVNLVNKDMLLGIDILAREAQMLPNKTYTWHDLTNYISTPKELYWLAHAKDPIFKRIWQNLSPSGAFGPTLLATSNEAFIFVKSMLNTHFEHLDNVGALPYLAPLLGLESDGKLGKYLYDADYARAIIRLKLMSPLRPALHPIAKGQRRSRYHQDKFVGREARIANFSSLCKELFPNLDCVTVKNVPPSLKAMVLFPEAEAADRKILDNTSMDEVKGALLRSEVVSPFIPENHFIPTDRLSDYFFCEHIPTEIRRQNLSTWLEQKVPTLDDIPRSARIWLGKYLGCVESEQAVAAQLAAQGFISNNIPKYHPLCKANKPSAYVRADIVGPDQARENLHEYLRYSYGSVERIRHDNYLRPILKLVGLKALTELQAYCRNNDVFRQITLRAAVNFTNTSPGLELRELTVETRETDFLRRHEYNNPDYSMKMPPRRRTKIAMTLKSSSPTKSQSTTMKIEHE